MATGKGPGGTASFSSIYGKATGSSLNAAIGALQVKGEIEALGKDFPDLGKAVKATTDGLQDYLKVQNDALAQGAVDSKIAAASIHRVTKKFDQLDKIEQKIMKGKAISLKEAKKLTELQKELAEVVEREQVAMIKASLSTNEFRKNLASSAADVKSWARGLPTSAAIAAGAAPAAAIAITRGLGQMGGGGGSAGGRLVGGLAGAVPGMGGQALQALIALGDAAIRQRGIAAKLITQKTLDFGPETGVGAGAVGADIRKAMKLMGAARATAAMRGQDPEALLNAMFQLSGQTGTQMEVLLQNGGDLMARIQELSIMGAGSVDEISAAMVNRIRSTKKTAVEITAEMEHSARAAREISAGTDRMIVITMTEFSNALKEVTDSIGSMATNQDALTESLKMGTIAAGKMGLSAKQALSVGKEIAKGLTSNYSKGFAIMEAGEDAIIAAARVRAQINTATNEDTKKGLERNLAIIEQAQEDFRAGKIQAPNLAGILEEIGATSELGIPRAIRTARRGESGAMVAASLGSLSELANQTVRHTLLPMITALQAQGKSDQEIEAAVFAAGEDNKELGDLLKETLKPQAAPVEALGAIAYSTFLADVSAPLTELLSIATGLAEFLMGKREVIEGKTSKERMQSIAYASTDEEFRDIVQTFTSQKQMRRSEALGAELAAARAYKPPPGAKLIETGAFPVGSTETAPWLGTREATVPRVGGTTGGGIDYTMSKIFQTGASTTTPGSKVHFPFIIEMDVSPDSNMSRTVEGTRIAAAADFSKK